MRKSAIWLIKWYQRHSPSRLQNVCRFTPSCSNYAILAIEKYGAVKGIIMSIKRIFKCKYPNGGEDYP